MNTRCDKKIILRRVRVSPPYNPFGFRAILSITSTFYLSTCFPLQFSYQPRGQICNFSVFYPSCSGRPDLITVPM